MNPVRVHLIAEGLLDEYVLRQLIVQTAPHLEGGVCYGKKGKAWLQDNLVKYNQAAQSWPYVVLGDLEQIECSPTLLRLWFPSGVHPNIQPRIAVRMVESLLLADRETCAEFLKISVHHIPQRPDDEMDPKQVMVNLARRSRSKVIREDMVPAENTTSKVGKNYVGQLEKYVRERWKIAQAKLNSPSLLRAVRALEDFSPVLPY